MNKILSITLVLSLLTASTLNSQSLQAVNLRVEHLDQPTGIGESAPRLSWQLQALNPDQRGLAQSAYRILVASTEDKLAKNRGDLWDSGKVMSNNTQLIRFGGSPLESRTRAYWKVTSWDQDGKAGKWSDHFSWSTGLLDRADWKAEWIAMENNHEFETSENVTFMADDPDVNTLKMRPAKYFRKEFDTEKSVRNATLYATAPRGI